MIDSVVELPDSHRTRRRVAINAHGRGQVELLLVHTQHLGSRLAEEEVDMFELMDQGQAFLQEMTRSRERPSPARRLAFRHCDCRRSFSVRAYDFRKYGAPQAFGESRAGAWPGKPSPSATLPEVTREQWIHDAPCSEVTSIDGLR